MKLIPIYSVPFWQDEYPEFEKEKQIILDACRRYRQENPSSETRSSVYGYQSPKFLHSKEELAPLFEYICQMAFKACAGLDFVDCDVALTESWVNINDSRQCMNEEHIHAEVFSGVFYLQAPEESGKLNIINPATSNRIWKGCSLTEEKNQFTAKNVKIEPTEGTIILFPSYLPHSVETNNHDEERISISFNVIAFPTGSLQSPQI